PRPGIYRRQLEIPGVDTKFIEARRGLLAELLDAVLPVDAVDRSASGARGFDRRFGLREEPALIRFRLLDARLAIRGLTDLTVPVEQFAALDLPVERVFVTENKINGLAFPDVPGALVIMGLGYGLDRLASIPWLPAEGLIYWGDIDTHGFAILNRLRHHIPSARSLLMDRDTLEAHRPLWTQEGRDQRFTGKLDRLTADEWQLFDDLRRDRLGERVRLEQERVGFGRLKERLGL
ncbi:MAG: Wadjet anti-phage system protein JetD domain-containing protein, partial [Guyparkeria sp.]